MTLELTPQHERAYAAYLEMRGFGGERGADVLESEQDTRRDSPDGQHRLKHLVPELAEDQDALARLLAEAAIFTHRADFISPAVIERANELFQLVNEHPLHGELAEALKPYVGMDAGKRHDMRDNRIRFAVHMALEAGVLATSKTGAPCACGIVSEVLQDAGLDDIGAASVADIWRGRSIKRERGAR